MPADAKYLVPIVSNVTVWNVINLTSAMSLIPHSNLFIVPILLLSVSKNVKGQSCVSKEILKKMVGYKYVRVLLTDQNV